jgi:branched-subunit amino acid aminotransferase/4-amino-4-deoxychorismate lyase
MLRLQASRTAAGAPRLVGVALPLGEGPDPGALAREARNWSAQVAPFPHEGPRPWSGCKVTNRLLLALAADAARATGADEALLFDSQGRLVEGARSNLFIAGRDGALTTPPLERGAVAGIAREVVMERLPQIVERDAWLAQVREAEELIAVNAVRGAHSIASLDGRPVGHGTPSRWLGLIARALAAD